MLFVFNSVKLHLLLLLLSLLLSLLSLSKLHFILPLSHNHFYFQLLFQGSQKRQEAAVKRKIDRGDEYLSEALLQTCTDMMIP